MLNSPQVRKLIRLAIEEDVAGGDITSELTVDKKLAAKAEIIAREKQVVCGLELIPLIFSELGYPLNWTGVFEDGVEVKKDTVIARLEASAQHLLTAERTILNFLQRLSGVATQTRRFMREAKGITLLDTRKTMPGYRLLDKYAVLVGGAKNHRQNLSDLILVKNNHVDANGGDMALTLHKVFEHKSPYIPVEVEVRDSAELMVALTFSPQIIMLDNFSAKEIKSALKLVAQSENAPTVEVSGGVSIERLAQLRKLGVQFASCGALTTQASNVDISMRLTINSPKKRHK